MMDELKRDIHTILTEKSEIDWLIIHSIAKSSPEIPDVVFSFIDGKERYDDPFKTNQGYISLEKSTTITRFHKVIAELTETFSESPLALANIFIIITRTSYKREDKELLLKEFKKKIGEETCNIIFNLLVVSLNTEYFKARNNAERRPANTDEWLSLFHSTQYMHTISDPIISSLQLVRSERSRKLDFSTIENMKPLLRAVLIGWYGFDLNISANQLKKICESEQELTFLSACLVDDFSGEKLPPTWLTQKLIDLFIEEHWKKIGKHVFAHIFGLSYRNNTENSVCKKLKNFVHKTLFKKISAVNPSTLEWIGSLEFPDDFISLFSWVSGKKIDYNQIPAVNRAEILNQFIRELRKIEAELPRHLATENSSDPFKSFQFSETKYNVAIVYLLLAFVRATNENLKDVKQICFTFKPLFYGGYRAISMAKHFTELMLLICLSGHSLIGLEEKEFQVLRKLLAIVADTLLVPYVHLSEREDEIWNPESKKELFSYNAGLYLINHSLSKIKKHEIKKHYDQFLFEVDKIKVAQ